MQPLLIFNGRFCDFTSTCAEIKALLIDRGEIQKLFYTKPTIASSNIAKLDLKGKYVLPGFTDCHTHLISRGLELQRIDLAECRSLNEILQKIDAQKNRNDIVFAQNFDDSLWSVGERNRLNRKNLDRITKKPLIIRRVCGHTAVVNTAALKRLPGKIRYVDSDTGRLYENAALFLNDIFRPGHDMLLRAIDLGMREAVRNGVTTVHEIGDPMRLQVLLEYKRRSPLKTRFVLYMYEKYAPSLFDAGLVGSWGDDLVRFAGIKIFLDGSIGARTAAIRRPYLHSNNHGKLIHTPERLKKIFKEINKRGIQLMIHAIGDKAVDLGLKTAEAYIDKKNPCRHRFEHLEMINQKLIDRLAAMNIIASMQPNFVRRWQGPDGLYERNFGRRYVNMNPFGTLKKAGVHLVFGSDNMPLGPIFGLKGVTEHPAFENRLPIKKTLAGYTTDPPYAAFEETRKGDFKVGKLADLVVLDRDPLNIADSDQLKIAMVMLGGRIVHKSHSR